MKRIFFICLLALGAGCSAPSQQGSTPFPSATSSSKAAPKATKKKMPIEKPVYYGSCRKVKAAGASPLYRGSPGYRLKLDSDGDGVACE